MGHRIVVTVRARKDLREIQHYIAIDDPSVASSYRDQLTRKIELTSNFSRAGRIVPEFGRPEIRELIRNPYRIIYRLDERERTVEVLRFWHAARGTPKI